MKSWWQYCNLQKRFYLFSILFACFGVLWGVISYHFDGQIIICPSKLIYNIPCPGCGMTRACLALLKLDFSSAFHYNMNSFIVLPVGIVCSFLLLWDLVFKNNLMYRLYRSVISIFNKRGWICLLLLFEGIIWVRNLVLDI